MEKKEFSLLDILQLIKTRWWILLLSATVVAVAAFLITNHTYKEAYSSTVTVYVDNQGSPDSSASDEVSQVKWAKEVINTYLSLLKTNKFMKEIATEYQAKNNDSWAKCEINNLTEKIQKRCTYTIIEETSLFTFTVTTHDRDLSEKIAKIFQAKAPGYIAEITGKSDAINTEADIPKTPAEPSNDKNLVRNTVIGFLVGVILSFIVVLIIDIADVRIKDEDDIIDSYTVPLLGSVPNFESAKKKGYGYGKK